MNTRIMSICNFKGGVGKSATTHALGDVLARRGHRILMIDADPQSSLTLACGVEDAADKSLAEVIGSTAAGTVPMANILHEVEDGLYLAPADIALAANELGLVMRMGRENVLKKALEPVLNRFDLVLIDCQPSLGMLTVNALTTSHGVLCPTQPTAQDLRGLKLLLNSVEEVRAELNPKLEVVGCVLTFFDRRLIHHRDALEILQQVRLPVLGKVPRSVRAAEAASACQAVTTFAPDNPTSVAYRDIATKVLAWAKSAATPARA